MLEGGLFIGHKNIVNICEIFEHIFLKTILGCYIGQFSHASSHVMNRREERLRLRGSSWP